MLQTSTIPIDEVITTDVCIVGSGPAGTTVARELVGQPFSVCIVESGGLLAGDRHDDLSGIETVTDFLQVKADARSRQFGGNARQWGISLPGSTLGVRNRPLDAIDFERREGVHDIGWPFAREALDPWYQRAHEALGMGRFAYDGADWADADHPCLPIGDPRVTTRMFQFCEARVVFEERWRELAAAQNVSLYLNATVLALETDESGGRVTRVRVAGPNGRPFSVDAKIVVLATGGLEDVQILLSSNDVHTRGIGNAHDLLGRFFMDHPIVAGGTLVPSDPSLFARTGLYDLRSVGGSFVMGLLALTDAAIRDEGLLNMSSVLFPRSRYCVPTAAKTSLRELLGGRALRDGTVGPHLRTLVSGRRDLADLLYAKVARPHEPLWYDFYQGGWSDDPVGNGPFHLFNVVHQTEQLPHPENRLSLSSSRDSLGRQRLKLDTQWRSAEIEGVRRSQEVFAEAIERSGIGRFMIASEEGRPVLTDGGTAHHMGTTRMHASPRNGVVDPECRVHGVPNLFIASSSVFPTAGYANPTLTIVALSIRIADRIKATLGPPITSGSAVMAAS